MAQGSEFPLRKPPGFHYDFFLLGITTFLAGLIGVPAPNGLIPQAPIHTRALRVMGRPAKTGADEEQTPALSRSESRSQTQSRFTMLPTTDMLNAIPRDEKPPLGPLDAPEEIPVAVVEQRVSNLAQGALCLVLLTGPFLHVLGLIPRGV